MGRDLRSLLPYLRKHARPYALGLLCLLITDGGQLYAPQLIRRAIDLVSAGGFPLPAVLRIAAEMAVLAMAVGLARFGWRYFLQGSSRRIELELRDRLFRHLQTLSSSFYGGSKVGDLMAHFTNDVNAVRQALSMGLVAFIDGFFMATAALVIVLAQNPGLGLLVISPLPVITAGVLLFGRSIRERFRKVQEGFSGLSDTAQESISGIRVVKTFAREQAFVRRFGERNARYSASNLALTRIWGLLYPAIGFLGGTTTLILLLAGGAAVMDGRLSPGQFTAFFAYLQMLIWPMIGAGFTFNLLQRAAASMGRINAILARQPDITSPPAPVRTPVLGALSFRGLSYGGVLADLSFELPAGGRLGILGRTGSGKSTLVRLIPRLIDPPPGTLFLDGVDVRDYDLQHLRRSVAMVPQDPFLFSVAIRENIAFGLRDADSGDGSPRGDGGDGPARVKRAAEISTITRDLSAFPQGWETVVGERGITLSGGQKQRVTLARALAADPAILVLDDALSSVDTETEEAILRELFSGPRRTLILISNRISTLRNADRILVLDAGRVAQEGTHSELVSSDGLYADIFRLQQLEEAYGRS